MPTMLHLVHCYISTFGTSATFGGCHHDGRGIWYRYPREGGVPHIIRGISHRTHTWQNQNFCLILTAFEGFEGAGQEADLKEQENLAKCNDSETVGTAVSHEKPSTAFNLFSWKKLSKGYRLINFNTSENAFKTYQTYQDKKAFHYVLRIFHQNSFKRNEIINKYFCLFSETCCWDYV